MDSVLDQYILKSNYNEPSAPPLAPLASPVGTILDLIQSVLKTDKINSLELELERYKKKDKQLEDTIKRMRIVVIITAAVLVML